MCDLEDIKTISPSKLKEYIDTHNENEYLLIDVRQPEEYTTGHIPGAKLIPILDIVADVLQLPNDKDLIFYCQSGQRSHSAGIIAFEEEFTNHSIYQLEGGIASWEGKTLPNYPRFDIFDYSIGTYDLLETAIKLEKGAQAFYHSCKNQFNNHPISSLFHDLSMAEYDHAKMLFQQLKHLNNKIKNFETLFSNLTFNTIEGGIELLNTLQTISSFKYPVMEIIDIALSIEYSAFDLYRGMGDKIKNSEVKGILYSIAQEEKHHMNTVIKGIEYLKK